MGRFVKQYNNNHTPLQSARRLVGKVKVEEALLLVGWHRKTFYRAQIPLQLAHRRVVLLLRVHVQLRLVQTRVNLQPLHRETKRLPLGGLHADHKHRVLGPLPLGISAATRWRLAKAPTRW